VRTYVCAACSNIREKYMEGLSQEENAKKGIKDRMYIS
jgi:hypothetical protein